MHVWSQAKTGTSLMQRKKTRLVLVTDKENKVGSHVPGLPNFLLGQEIRLGLNYLRNFVRVAKED